MVPCCSFNIAHAALPLLPPPALAAAGFVITSVNKKGKASVLSSSPGRLFQPWLTEMLRGAGPRLEPSRVTEVGATCPTPCAPWLPHCLHQGVTSVPPHARRSVLQHGCESAPSCCLHPTPGAVAACAVFTLSLRQLDWAWLGRRGHLFLKTGGPSFPMAEARSRC